MRFLTFLLMLVSGCVSGTGLAEEASFYQTSVFPAGLHGVSLYRIPGIVATPQGTLLAYCEARRTGGADWGEIEVHLRRSLDAGRTWEPVQHIAHLGERIEGNPHKRTDEGAREQTVNNPVAIVDHVTGSIEFLYCVNYARCFSMRSTDDGLTWSSPEEITAVFEPFRKDYDWTVIAMGPGHGVQLPSGRLVVPIWLAYGKDGAHSPSAAATIYSDDHGKSWHAGEIAVHNKAPFGNPNETMLAVRASGDVLLVTRNESTANRKIVSVSSNGATDWSEPQFHPELWEPICMASVLTLPGNPQVMLFSNPHSLARDKNGDEVPRGRGKRENLSIKLSRDDGATWPIQKVLVPGQSAYSDLASLPDQTIVCLYEGQRTIDVAVFNLAWLTSP